jgi:hypothetical protein
MERLAYKPFNGLDNPGQVDLWPFFTSPLTSRAADLVDSRRLLLSRNIAEALEICGPTTFSYQAARDQNVELSNQAVLFRCLIPYMPRWLASSNLLGRYAITGERYAVALKPISRYLLRLPKDQLAKVFESKHIGLSASLETFCICMEKLPQSIELYFFVLFMSSVMVDHGHASIQKSFSITSLDGVDPYATAQSAKTYLLLVSKQRT